MNRLDRWRIVNLINGFTQPDSADYNVQGHKDVIGWKGGFYTVYDSKLGTNRPIPVLIKLLIPKDAYRTSYHSDIHEKYCKHRCSEAKVLGFYSYYTGKEIKWLNGAFSFYTIVTYDDLSFDNRWMGPKVRYVSTSYIKDYTVLPDLYRQSLDICAGGIHYFYEKQSALLYLDQEVVGTNMKPRYNSLPFFNPIPKAIIDMKKKGDKGN